MSEQMKQVEKKQEKKAQEQTRFNKIITTIDTAVKEATSTQQWVSVDLISIEGYRLTINVSPNGTPALTLISPSLKNRFVFKDEETIRIVAQIVQEFINDKELKEATFAVLSKHGWGERNSKTKVFKI